jgi:hypothetical protein
MFFSIPLFIIFCIHSYYLGISGYEAIKEKTKARKKLKAFSIFLNALMIIFLIIHVIRDSSDFIFGGFILAFVLITALFMVMMFDIINFR